MAMAPIDRNDPALLLILQTLAEHTLLLEGVTSPMERQIAKIKAEISAVEQMLMSADGHQESYRAKLRTLNDQLVEAQQYG